MTREQFVNNNRGIDAGRRDLPRAFLERLYDSIVGSEVRMGARGGGEGGEGVGEGVDGGYAGEGGGAPAPAAVARLVGARVAGEGERGGALAVPSARSPLPAQREKNLRPPPFPPPPSHFYTHTRRRRAPVPPRD